MQARRLPARQGLVWVVEGFRLFRANPPLLTILTFVYLMVFTVMLVLPGGVGGVIFPILQPLLTLAIANGCRGIASMPSNGGSSGIKRGPPPDLLAGIRTQRNKLFKLGALQLIGSLLVMLIMVVLGAKPDPEKPDEMLQTLALAVTLSLPLLLAFWFAPLLTGWHELPPLKSAFFSLIAALRNWRAFLVYALTLMAITVLPATLAAFAMQVSEGFGQFAAKTVEVLMIVLILPIFLSGAYVSYRDIFITTPEVLKAE